MRSRGQEDGLKRKIGSGDGKIGSGDGKIGSGDGKIGSGDGWGHGTIIVERMAVVVLPPAFQVICPLLFT